MRRLTASLIFSLSLCFALGTPSAEADAPAVAAPSSPVAPSAVQDGDFLLLPAFDLEQSSAPGKPRAAMVADRLSLKIVNGPTGAGLKIEAAPAATPTAESLLDQGWQLLASEGASITVVPLKAGAQTLPSLVIRDSQGKAIGRTNPLPMDIASAIPANDPKPDQPAEAKSAVPLPFPWKEVAVYALIALLLVAGLVYWAVRAFGKRSTGLPALPAQPPKPEDVVALARLAQLEQSDFVMRGQYKPYYFQLSEILKNYIGGRYQFDATESTSREIIQRLEERRITTDTKIDRIEGLFGDLDRVKFSDHVPDAGEPERLLGEAREFVLKTRRPPLVVQPAPKGRGSARP